MSRGLDRQGRRAYFLGTPDAITRKWWEKRNAEILEAEVEPFLTELTKRQVLPPPPPPPPPVAVPLRPYKLLDYYETQDASLFFGRQQGTHKLTSLIHAHRLVLLCGASGVGKTSLLRAGAMPRLEHADPPYETMVVRSLEDPALVIRHALQRRLPEASLPESATLVDFLDAATKALGRTLVIILDQFEEFFIRFGAEFRAAFIAELGALYDARHVPVKVVLCLREDWLASMSEVERRIPEVFHVQMRLLPLDPGQASEAITKPAELLGMSYEPALIKELLKDLAGQEGALVLPPRLQLVCSALYDKLKPGERHITLGTRIK